MLRSYVPAGVAVASIVEDVRRRRWLWCLAAVVVVGLRHFLAEGAPPLGPKFSDTDDALRLIQVREFLINGNWYDLRLPSIGAPEPLVSHWSRLIDLPIAILISVFALFLPYLSAELAAAVVWPLILLFALTWFIVNEAWRRGGDRAALIALLLLLLCASGLIQFAPGRIDHHNAQILLAVVGLVLLQRCIAEPVMGWWAGAAIAAGIVIGYEALPLLAVCVAITALFACFDAAARPGITRTIIALTLGLAVGFVATTPPAAWLLADCDRIGINLVGLCLPAAAASGLLHCRYRDAGPWVWLAGFTVAGVTGLALYLTANPICSQGAFTGIDPLVETYWLSIVVEGQSLIQYFRLNPAMVITYCITMAIAVTIVVHQALQTRTTESIVAAGVLVLATGYGFYYMKLASYASLLGLLPVACWIARLPAIGTTAADVVRIRALLATNQTVYILLVTGILGINAAITGKPVEKVALTVGACMVKSDIQALAKLPPGLIVSERDLGPFIAVATRHRVYAGPYHRLHRSIRDLIVLQRAPLAEAGRLLAAMNADYLVLCGPGRTAPEAAAVVAKAPVGETRKFANHMRFGGRFPGLERVSIGATVGPLMVWRIVKPAG